VAVAEMELAEVVLDSDNSGQMVYHSMMLVALVRV
jgi:hypothetical protein